MNSNKSWTNTPPKFYYWNTQPAGTTTAWPGMAMTSEGNAWYVYTLPGGTCSNFIFNNNTAPQSPYLTNYGESFYDNGFLPLPVSPVNMSANRTGSQVTIGWTVANQLNVQKYGVEHSADGRRFTAIGNTPATTGSNRYAFINTTPQPADNDYRLQSVDADGRPKR